MKDKLQSTIEYYNSNAEEFIEGTLNADMSACMDSFFSYVEPGGTILDAGCGSGRDALAFLQRGYKVEAFDASEELCRKASEYSGVEVRCLRFEEFCEYDRYDGIWACASLLHVEREQLPTVLGALRAALKPDGVIYVSFKYGDSDRMKGGRFFVDMNEKSITELLTSAGMKIVECFVTGDVREGRSNEKWINAIARR